MKNLKWKILLKQLSEENMTPIEKLVHKYYQVEVYTRFDNCWINRHKPQNKKYSTYTVFKFFPKYDCCIYFTSVGYFDESLCNTILGAIETGDIGEFCTCKVLRIFDGLKPNKYKFDNLAVVNYETEKFLSSFDPKLSKKFSRVFPIFECELSGSETWKQLLIRGDRAFIMSDWQRKPSPKTLIRYRLKDYNSRTYISYAKTSC